MNNKNQNSVNESIRLNLTSVAEELSLPHEHVNYSEIPGLISPSVDVLNQFHSNLKSLSDLHTRLQFMMGEIQGVLKK